MKSKRLQIPNKKYFQVPRCGYNEFPIATKWLNNGSSHALLLIGSSTIRIKMNIEKDKKKNIILSNVSQTNGYLCVWCTDDNKIERKKTGVFLIWTISGKIFDPKWSNEEELEIRNNEISEHLYIESNVAVTILKIW